MLPSLGGGDLNNLAQRLNQNDSSDMLDDKAISDGRQELLSLEQQLDNQMRIVKQSNNNPTGNTRIIKWNNIGTALREYLELI